MGLFSGITKAIGSVFDTVKSVFNPTDLVTSGLDFLGGQLTNSANAANTAAANTTSIELANTAHQREVRDLLAAGLNPILSSGGKGAVTPGIQVPEVGNPIGQAVNSARASSEQQATVQNIQAQTAKTKADTVTATTQAALNAANIQKAKSDTAYTNSATANNAINNVLLKSNVPGASNKANVDKSMFGKIMSYINPIAGTVGSAAQAAGSVAKLVP